MLGTVLEKTSGLVQRRFLLNAVVPSLAFWGSLYVLVVLDRGDLPQTIRLWGDQPATLQLVEALAIVVWLLFFASVLAATMTDLVRLYEGYWSFPLASRFVDLGRRYHQHRLSELMDRTKHDPGVFEVIYRAYPPPSRPEEVMPTRLGNILKNAELYPVLRYGLPSAALVWPRLYHLLPPNYLQVLAEARSGLDFMVTVSFLAAAFGAVSGLYLVVVGTNWWLFLVCIWGGFGAAWLAYQAALGNALLYAEQVKVAFDLYRHQLFKELRLPLPATLAEEVDSWQQLTIWLYRSGSPSVRFTEPDAGAP